MQPFYHLKHSKIEARRENISIYRNLLKRHSLPPLKQYWTLCNYQPTDHPGSEIIQLKSSGLIRDDSQFYGVDRDGEIIIQNKIWHPNARWYCGEWEDVIGRVSNFNPAMVYMDVTSWNCTHRISNIVCSTLQRCPVRTLLLINLMLNDPRTARVFSRSIFLENIERTVPSFELKKWKRGIKNFTYNSTGKTEMITYIFFKEKK